MYLSLLILILKNNFDNFLTNIIIILKDKNKLIVFLIFLPLVFIIITLQIYLGLIFGIYYLSVFLIYYKILKTNYIINCKEIPLNTSFLIGYSIFNLFLFIPKAKAYLIVYNILNTLYNNKIIKNYNLLFITFIGVFLTFFIKTNIYFIIGFSYLSIYTTSEFIISLFNTLSWKYESFKAKYQHVILNCLMDNKDSIGFVNNLNIIIDKNVVIFNTYEFIHLFLKKVKKAEYLQKAFNFDSKKILEKAIYDNHFNFSISSSIYKDRNVSKNLTHSYIIKAENEKKEIININCDDSYKPNLIGQNKINNLTKTYEIDKSTAIRGELKGNELILMQDFSKNAYISIILDRDEKIFYSKDGKFYTKEGSLTIEEYCKEYKITISENIDNLNKFEEFNKDFLETYDGKNEYNMYKNLMKGIYIKKNTDFNFNND